MKKLIFKWILKYLDKPLYTRLKKDQIADLLDHIANDPASKEFTDYLDQLADGYKTQFLYTLDPHYKGMIAAYIVLREVIVEKREASILKKKKEEKRRIGNKKRIVKY